ncbi:MAG: transglutaminase-like domain-containing protein [Pirellulales bacterium]
MHVKSKLTVIILALAVQTIGQTCSWTRNLFAQTSLNSAERAAIDKLPKVPSSLNSEFWIDRHSAQTVQTKLSMTVTTNSLVAETWVFALPENPTTPGQVVHSSSTIPSSKRIRDRSVLARPILYTKFSADSEELKRTASIQADSEVELYSRSLRSGKEFGGKPKNESPQVDLLPELTRKYFLRPTGECDYNNKAFQEWKAKNELAREETEGEVLFAKRVFQKLVRNYKYVYIPDQNRSASAICKIDKTDCGGLSILFSALMRSEGIPARVLAGRWAKSAKDGELIDGSRYYQYHVIAEFYADGVGWVPLDLSSTILHDRTPEKMQYFGQDHGNFVVMHVDTGIDFDSGLFGKYRNAFLQIPAFWVRGTGTLKDKKVQESWEVVTISSNRSK